MMLFGEQRKEWPRPMLRVPPSRRIAQDIAAFLATGISEGEDVTGRLVHLGAQRLIQEALEAEVADYLGRDHYMRRQEDEEHRGYRNGYAQRTVRAAEGPIPVSVPQVRDTGEPYRSRLLEFLKGNTDVLDRLVVEMYARGLSTRDIEDTFTDITGECLISRTGVSRVTEALWEEYEAFATRELAGFEVEYLFLDAIYESLRERAGASEAVLCAWAILRDGQKVLLHLALGNKESYAAWLEFLRDMVKRGLRVPLSVTTDGAPGLVKAVDAMWPESMRVRCWVHKARNILDKVSAQDTEQVRAHLHSIRDAATPEAGHMLSEQFVQAYEVRYPSAIRSWQDDLEASLAHLRLPVVHRKFVRTTNLIERAFVEERRRTKVIPRFFDEKSCLKLVFASLWRASQRWRRVRFSEHEQAQVRRLRLALGIDPPEPDELREASSNQSDHIVAG